MTNIHFYIFNNLRGTILLSLTLFFAFCKTDTPTSVTLKKMDCKDFSQKLAASDTMSVSAGVIVSNLKKIVDIETGIKNELIASYSADTKNNIAYSPEFCIAYNGLVDMLNAQDKNRRNDNNLSPQQRQSAEDNYTNTLNELQRLLLNGIRTEIGGGANSERSQGMSTEEKDLPNTIDQSNVIENEQKRYQTVTPPFHTKALPKGKQIKSTEITHEKPCYFSNVNVGFQIERATLNGKNISVERGSISPFVKKGDILKIYGKEQEKEIIID
ncbi:MAG TPA: hypothetical protein PLO67_09525 [Saprospiraceae bacterium]|nr:hypothetical protein [Saprospiraceae bacterium]